VNPSELVRERVRVPHSKQSGCLDQVAANPDFNRSMSEGASRLGENGIACPAGLVSQTGSTGVVFPQCDQGTGDRIAREWSWVALVQP